MFAIYKKGQGASARISVGVALGLIAFFSACALHGALINLPVFYEGARVPLVNLPLSWGLVSAFVFFLLCAAFAALLVGCFEVGVAKVDNLGKGVVSFLIDTQAELNKVSWPSRAELVGSTVVVIICAVILGAYIFGIDRLVTTVMKSIGIL